MLIGQTIESASELRQGDVVDVEWVPAVVDGAAGAYSTSCGVAVLSQTCDVVQGGANKANVTVAPIICSPNSAQLSMARSGRAPLMLHLRQLGETPEAIVDVQRSTSVPKEMLVGRKLIGRHADGESSQSARNLAERVGRVYSRFAFPDEVVPVLDKMKKKARDASRGSGAFGRVLDYLDFRVQANHWEGPGRVLKLFVVVDSALLIAVDDADPDWTWETASVVGLKGQERVADIALTRLSELLADSCDTYLKDSAATDGTTLLRLWELWVKRLQENLLDPHVNEEVTAFLVELVGDDEFPVSQWRQTVSLDLEDLSDAIVALEPEIAAPADSSIRSGKETVQAADRSTAWLPAAVSVAILALILTFIFAM